MKPASTGLCVRIAARVRPRLTQQTRHIAQLRANRVQRVPKGDAKITHDHLDRSLI
jgi:hypothetical protein